VKEVKKRRQTDPGRNVVLDVSAGSAEQKASYMQEDEEPGVLWGKVLVKIAPTKGREDYG